MEIKLAVLAILAVLKFIGEIYWHNAQRYILPLIYCIAVSTVTGIWWSGLMVLPMIGILVMGYGINSPLKHALGNSGARGMWLFLVLVVANLGLVLTHHLSLAAYLPICIAAGIWGATTRDLPNYIIAPITGVLIGLPILFIK